MRSFDCAILNTTDLIAVAEVADAGITSGVFEDCCAFDAMVMRVMGIVDCGLWFGGGVAARMIAVGGVGDVVVDC